MAACVSPSRRRQSARSSRASRSCGWARSARSASTAASRVCPVLRSATAMFRRIEGSSSLLQRLAVLVDRVLVAPQPRPRRAQVRAHAPGRGHRPQHLDVERGGALEIARLVELDRPGENRVEVGLLRHGDAGGGPGPEGEEGQRESQSAAREQGFRGSFGLWAEAGSTAPAAVCSSRRRLYRRHRSTRKSAQPVQPPEWPARRPPVRRAGPDRSPAGGDGRR